ncbi:hypothetical protein CDD82_3817 [Ophiocordyceps australis]|uniref:Uncharacterized protein n=1 Tax=Ophiocordyceps australis TaxID=1399860 RepID=A0A2C5ZV82_9HYPO|nr:hypothetical protein CDD82_3817 [Ophiocordyceps australis]
MENPLFSEDEKRFVLCEIIKTSRIEVEELIFFIQAHNVLPNWMRVLMPPGRNLAQCLAVANMMSILPRARPPSTPTPSSSRSPLAATPRHATTTPPPPPPPPRPHGRPHDCQPHDAPARDGSDDEHAHAPKLEPCLLPQRPNDRKKRRCARPVPQSKKLRPLAPRPPPRRSEHAPSPPPPPNRMLGYRHILPAKPRPCLTTPPAEKPRLDSPCHAPPSRAAS